MASIEMGIGLQDNFTSVLYGIINSVNLTVNSLAGLSQAMNNLNTQLPVVSNTLPAQPASNVMPDNSVSAQAQSAVTMLQKVDSAQRVIGRNAQGLDILSAPSIQNINGAGLKIQDLQQKMLLLEHDSLDIDTKSASMHLEQLKMQMLQATQQQNNLNETMQDMDASYVDAPVVSSPQADINTEQQSDGQKKGSWLGGKVKGKIKDTLTLDNLQKVLDMSDQMTQTTVGLDLMNDGNQTTSELQDMIYESSKSSHTSYADMGNMVASMGNNAGGAFNSNEEMIDFMEQVNKQFAIAGTAPEDQSAAIAQLSGIMASGEISGGDLSSILEAAPGMRATIEQNMGWEEGSLQSHAENGDVNAEVVKGSLLNMSEETNAAFADTPMTFAQMMTDLQSTALMAFQPILAKINEIGNSQAFQNFVNIATVAIQTLGEVLTTIFSLVESIGSFVADNWSIISPLIYGVIAALSVYYGWLLLINGIELISKGIKMASSAASAIKATATGIIMGALAVAGAFIWNLLLGLLDLVLGIVNFWVNKFVIFANFFANLFENPISSVIYLFQGMADNVLGILENIAKAMDKIFHTKFSNTISKWRDDLKGMADKVVSNYAPDENYQKVIDEVNLSSESLGLKRVDYGEAWDSGYKLGQGIDSTVSGWFDNKKDDKKDDKEDDKKYYEKDPSEYDPYSALNNNNDSLNTISEDTGAIKDSVEISEEDLKYLRDAAEQETVNRFTTAEVTINQTNNNKVSSGLDLDGIVTGLTNAMSEAVSITTEGVHAYGV